MNVLILTPDAVGSTLLQRLITIYMQFHSYDRPVINLHELTNGLVRYHNTYFNQEVLGKRLDAWGYHQSLEQIVELLRGADHYKTSRLAHYHIQNRQDSIADQISFYQYLNDNFYIISCRRHNVFEHALSWGLTKVTKKLNVYTADEKINDFFELYRDGIDLDPNSLIQTLNAYKKYVVWCDNHFNVANYFYYEEHLPRIEKYILNLPIFSQQSCRLTWKDNFGIDFDHWNLCHYFKSDLGSVALDRPEQFAQLTNSTKIIKNVKDNKFLKGYQQVADPSWPAISSLEEYNNLPKHIRDEVENVHGLIPDGTYNLVTKVQMSYELSDLRSDEQNKFLEQYQKLYYSATDNINKMIESGVMINPPPIKKQTLAEKKHIIKNYNHLLDVYNQWIIQNPDIGLPLNSKTLDQFAEIERKRWSADSTKTALVVEQNSR